MALFIVMMLMLALLLYTWLVYPLMMSAMSRNSKPAFAIAPAHHNDTPPLFIILSAFNEADVITARIQNLLEADYPTDLITVLIGTDGCTDSTATLARSAAAQSPHIIITEYAVNRGKVAVLRDLAAQAAQRCRDTPPLLVFTDANTRFQPDALHRLQHHFSDPSVGGVCGCLRFTGTGRSEENTYWNIENMLKAGESNLDSCLGANGAIYAIRAECFWHDIPDNTIVDDFVIGMKVREAGFRMRYDPEAIAEEDIPEIRDEWCRRIRIGSGDYQAALLCKACLHPRFGRFAWCFWSHKILRWFTPHILLLMTVSSIALAIMTLHKPAAMMITLTAHAVCLGTAALLAAAITGRLSRRDNRTCCSWPLRLCRGADHFVTMQAALFAGFLRFCRGNLAGTWQRTPRSTP